MQTQILRTETLGSLPLLAEQLDQRLREAIADCANQPDLKRARTIKIELALTPSKNDPDDVIIEPKVSMRLPTRALPPVTARRQRGHQLQFDLDFEAQEE